MSDISWMYAPAIAVVVGIVVFLLLRECVCWYWKMNEVVDLLEEIRDRLPERKE